MFENLTTDCKRGYEKMCSLIKSKWCVLVDLWHEFTMLIFLLLMAYFILPEAALVGLFSILISKMVYIYAGVIMAHITRKFLFPYIDFATEQDWSNNLMVIAIYVVIIYCMAAGG
jgi:hypothetical protein